MFSESSKEQFASTNIAEELVRLFQKQTEHEKKEMIFEVLAPLAENGNVIFLLSSLSSIKGHIHWMGGVEIQTLNSERLQCSAMPLDENHVHLLYSKLSSQCESCFPG